jgi:hypothetical protein
MVTFTGLARAFLQAWGRTYVRWAFAAGAMIACAFVVGVPARVSEMLGAPSYVGAIAAVAGVYTLLMLLLK